MLHVVLAELPSVGCVLHTHSVWGTLLSDYFFEEGGFEIAGYEMLKGLEGITTHDTSHWIPIFENTQDIPALAREVRARLADPMESMTHGFLIRRHGFTLGAKTYLRRGDMWRFTSFCLNVWCEKCRFRPNSI